MTTVKRVLILLVVLYATAAGRKEVLITGSAGFIGFHTALRLIETGDTHITAVDSFNDHYDVNLKKARAAVLQEKGVTVNVGDLCNEQMVEYLFKKNKFDVVIHLAAEDGAAQSLKDPINYVTANKQCLLSLLEVLKNHSHTHLVFTSSSSVYGSNVDVPFSPDSPLGTPYSIYAALKEAGEYIVEAYCEKYELSVVVLRPFSVYGPWGRPDLEVYKMALNIQNKKTVVIYQYNKFSASRDFTYIDDIVNGVLLAMDYKPKRCNEVYNLGRGEPVSFDNIYSLLQKELGRSTTKKYIPLPSYEVPVSHADISLSQQVLGYQPKTNVEEGIKKFVQWFKEYHIHKKWKSPEPNKSLKDKLSKDRIVYLNEQYSKRIGDLRKKYQEYAEKNNIEVAKFYRTKKFIEYKGLKTHGGGIKKFSEEANDYEAMERMCNLIYECVAFTLDGYVFSNIGVKSTWHKFSGTFYVADMDVCKAGYTTCYGNHTCTYLGPSQYKCECAKGWGPVKSDFCVELYSPGKKTQIEKEHEIVDLIDGRNWTEFKGDGKFYRFEHKYFFYGAVAFYPDAKGDVEKLKKACEDTYHCMGFTTNGELKRIIYHYEDWKSHSSIDVYVRDVDYCTINPLGCTRGKKCYRDSPGKYACK